MLIRRPLLLSALAVGLVVPMAGPALAHDTGALAARTASLAAPEEEAESSQDMEHIANLQYGLLPGGSSGQSGSDIEFATIGGKDYALAGTLRNGMQIVDITDPTSPEIAGVYDCPITQGDIQVFQDGDRVLATYTADSRVAASDIFGDRSTNSQLRFESQCVSEVIEQQPADAEEPFDGNNLGTFIVDITDPTAPTTVSFFQIDKGSHNQTVHPSGDYTYNSNSDLIVNSPIPQITIHDISDPEKPTFVQNFSYLPGQPALGEESHDIFFNAAGDRAYVASLGSTLILDTTDVEKPEIISQFIDPQNSLVHGAKMVSLPREDGTMRDLLITTDEQAGALPQSTCPGGGLHVYDITGDKEQDPFSNKQGVWFIPNMSPAPGETCTAHVLRIYPDQQLLTIAWYSQGVRTLDISGLAEFEGNNTEQAFGDGIGMKEVGNFVFPDSDTWSFKTNRIDTDGSFFGYGNDIGRGFDVYEFTGALVDGRTVPALEPTDLAPVEEEPAPTESPAPQESESPAPQESEDPDPQESEDPDPQESEDPDGQDDGAQDCSAAPVASDYTDRDQAREVHKRSIDCVIAREIARGEVENGEKVYQPLQDVTREQMATFIVNTLRASGTELPAPKQDAFDDIANSFHREPIQILAAAGIVEGTSGTMYAPKDTVTRQQMASFMVRAAQFAVEPDLVETGERRFTDAPDGPPHADNIAIGDDNGLFQGTTATTFAPTVVVKRDQMASFLINLLGVTDDGSSA